MGRIYSMRILYICNCKCDCHNSVGCVLNGGPCSHTHDINYSKNFTETPIVADNNRFKNVSNDYRETCYVEIEEEKDGRD